MRTISARILRVLAREGRLRAGDRVVLSISGVGEREMAHLNFKHRRRRGPTDVLSFEQKGAHAPRGVRFLGDLVLCLPVVRAHAREHSYGVYAELAILITHGLLHLLGFDHERSTHEAKRMSGLERKILDRATRGPTGRGAARRSKSRGAARVQKRGRAGLIARAHAKARL